MPSRTDSLVRLASEFDLTGFDCGDPDLNDFLQNDARQYMAELLAVTYLVTEAGKAAAFFSLANDTLICDLATQEGKSERNRLQRRIPHKKQRRSYPAVKLCRLAVETHFQRTGLGREILDYLKVWFITGNKTGCRFITVDAYNNERTLRFYERNGFRFLTSTDKTENTRQMYFDLKPFADLNAGDLD